MLDPLLACAVAHTYKGHVTRRKGGLANFTALPISLKATPVIGVTSSSKLPDIPRVSSAYTIYSSALSIVAYM